MELIIRKRDVMITLVVIAAFGAACAHHLYDKQRIEQQLHDFARNEAILNVGGESELEKHDFISIVHSEKSFYIAGPAYGFIHSFTRQKGDEDMKSFKGYEYYLKYEDGAWRQVDSAGCGALEHHVDGFEEFERRGLKVAQGAYDKALGFGENKATAKKHDHENCTDHDHAHDHEHDTVNAKPAAQVSQATPAAKTEEVL